MLYAQKADLRQVGLGDLLLGVGYMRTRRESGKGHFHVGLPGGKPHVAHQQVRKGKVGAAVDDEGKRTAGRLGFEPASHSPTLEVVTVMDCPWKVTVTFSAGESWPRTWMGTGDSRHILVGQFTGKLSFPLRQVSLTARSPPRPRRRKHGN